MSFIHDFGRIDIAAPWLSPYRQIHHAYAAAPACPLAPWLDAYFDAHAIAPTLHGTSTALSFTSQDALERGSVYESHIGRTATIPTRDNLHDWFGACVWSVFPKTKALLNAKHLAHMHECDGANGRNRLRDTITIFDENGAIVVVSDKPIGHNIAAALADFDWQNALVRPRSYWADSASACASHTKVAAFIFGHALLEQLITPYKSLCSHAVILPVPPTFFAMTPARQLAFVDDFLCFYMKKFLRAGVTPRQLHPLPILGVPHFWQENSDPAFYDDAHVFRAGRHRGV